VGEKEKVVDGSEKVREGAERRKGERTDQQKVEESKDTKRPILESNGSFRRK
jgi:hypothetical protein